MPEQFNVRIPKSTGKQIEDLVRQTEMTQTQIVILAVDRLHREMMRYFCDQCGKDVGNVPTRYCKDCREKIWQRMQPRDCRYCGGVQTVQATYQFESDYGRPYICHSCMKDQSDGYVWPSIPETISEAAMIRGEV